MKPVELARIHAAAFAHERHWTEREFAVLLAQDHTRAFSQTGGFALTQTVAGDSELLMLAVDPAHQRKGIARTLMNMWLEDISKQAETAFLEVSADNEAALALYEGLGFERSGLRKSYYKRVNAPAVDAVVMTRTL